MLALFILALGAIPLPVEPSLAQIDAEVKEAEAVMHGFLKELGYE